MLQQIGHRDFHHIGERLWIQAHVQNGDGQQSHDREFAGIDVRQLFDIVIGHRAEVNTLEHPQGVSRAKDQGRSGQQTHDEVVLDCAENDHPLTHKTCRAWQTAVGHGKQQRKGSKLGHGVDHPAIA